MGFDADRFTHDNQIEIAGSDSKHYREGWINIPCPFCEGNPGYHLGYNTDSDYWNCHRCGWHSIEHVIQALLNTSWDVAVKTAKTYGSRPSLWKASEAVTKRTLVKLPTGTESMQKAHKQYLIDRNFDPDKLEEEWDLKGTGFIGPYKFRIIAPIYHKGVLVSYQGRDITNRSKLKYKACRAENEAIPHKHLLYGLNNAVGHSAVVVEGITDVWRLGRGAVATFGLEWSIEQAILLKTYPRVFIMYDFGEKQAIEQALKLGNILSSLGVSVELLTAPDHEGDPADLSNKQAQALMEKII